MLLRFSSSGEKGGAKEEQSRGSIVVALRAEQPKPSLATMTASSSEPPFVRIGPDRPSSPVVLSVPHAGRSYSPQLLAASRLSLETLEALEDRLVDRLVWRAVADGATAIVARTPRAEIDLNRDEREIDPVLVSPMPSADSVLASARARGGLGLIPARIPGAGSIWLKPMSADELKRRIDRVHRPYHQAIASALEETRARFGIAILLDCHSMPPRQSGSPGEAAVVFGDRHGTTMASELVEAAVAAARSAGFTTSRNAPYAGGYITTRHGRPDQGVHALQIEIDRSTYLDAHLRSAGPGFDEAAALIADVASALAARASEPPQVLAAE
jgi:N-formylglutamate amidohydrolase